MPWRIPEDLKRFKALTLGHPVIMGRKTFESIGRPLPGRENIIITRSKNFAAPGCRMAHSLHEALAAVNAAGEVFVIGGAEIYALALPAADRLQLTEIDAEVEGDAFFPAFDRALWREIAHESRGPDALGDFGCRFVTYDRIR